MDIKFKYQGCTLENPEAAALMKAAKAKQPFEIDLETLIDVKIMDSDKLFSLSVEQKSSALASLAFKLATSEKQLLNILLWLKTNQAQKTRNIKRSSRHCRGNK